MYYDYLDEANWLRLNKEYKMIFHCFRCRAKHEARDVAQVVLKNGKHAAQGFCTVCGTKVFKIVATPK